MSLERINELPEPIKLEDAKLQKLADEGFAHLARGLQAHRKRYGEKGGNTFVTRPTRPSKLPFRLGK
jgi:hypothetical protein